MPVRPMLLHRMALVSFRLFCKNLGNLQQLFGQMVYRPPPAKNCPYAYACRQSRERAGRCLAWKTRIFVLLSFNCKLLCSIQALTLLMQASSLTLVSSRSQASEVLNAQYVCAVVSILMEGDFMVTHFVPNPRCVHCVQ